VESLPSVSTTPAVHFGTGTAGVVDILVANFPPVSKYRLAADVNDSLMNCGVAFVIIFHVAI
jgi:hypothetical protein